jgi:hypothetical protein
MPIVVVVALPAHALESLMDRYRNGDPELRSLLRELGVLAIVPEDERGLGVWENEGGTCS